MPQGRPLISQSIPRGWMKYLSIQTRDPIHGSRSAIEKWVMQYRRNGLPATAVKSDNKFWWFICVPRNLKS